MVYLQTGINRVNGRSVMRLVIDAGNSQISFGVFEKSRLIHHFRVETRHHRTAEEYASILFPLLDIHGLKRVFTDGIALCSVVTEVDLSLFEFCEKYLLNSPLKIHSGLKLGFELNVLSKDEVGADRLANAAYAVKYLKLPAIVVDMGTATTLDVISKNGSYEGGVILPGPRLAFESLSLKTSKLPFVSLHFPDSVIGKTTPECIQSGVMFGYCELISGLIRRTEKELGDKADCVLTGGFSFLFEGRLLCETRFIPDLTLEGISIIYDTNR